MSCERAAGRRYKYFSGLTRSQDAALAEIALGGQPQMRSKKTIAALVARGLIYGTQVKVGHDSLGDIEITVYEMPLAEHMRWCQWCAENYPDEPALQAMEGGK